MIQSKDTELSVQQAAASSNPPPVLLAQDLHKSYGSQAGLRGLSFSLQAGRVLGFLGPNGAGKTTTIRILTTILEPTSGNFTVDGISSKYPERIRQRIGVLPEGLGFPKGVTAFEYLTYFSQLYGQSAAEAREISQTLLKDVGLQNRANSAIGTFSHGMRQRLGIARALINDPKVVFLDEPTLGLDPRGQQELLALIRRIARDRNTGVVLSSHLLSEIEGICDDVVILNAGEVVAKGTVAEVSEQALQNVEEGSAIRVRVLPGSSEEAQQILQALPDVTKVAPADMTMGLLAVELANSNGRNAAAEPVGMNNILEALIHAGIPILGFEILGGRLQDVFLKLTAETIE